MMAESQMLLATLYKSNGDCKDISKDNCIRWCPVQCMRSAAEMDPETRLFRIKMLFSSTFDTDEEKFDILL